MSRRRHVIARLDDFPPGARRIVALGGRAGIGVFNVAGRFFALRNICPHEGAPLCRGAQRALVRAERVGDRYEYAYERDGEILACPWHEWEFDLTTGRALHDPRQRVKTYPVAVEGDEVVLYLDG
jgi:3-phenylpropionate/trans-cinnamate dioxygenase ferredoxin subunit